MTAARLTVRGWAHGLRVAVAELAAARLRWCLICGRVGWWGWRPLTPSMPIPWVCIDQLACRQRRRWWRPGRGDGAAPGGLRETARAGPAGIGPAVAPLGFGLAVRASVPGPPRAAGSSAPPLPHRFQGGSS